VLFVGKRKGQAVDRSIGGAAWCKARLDITHIASTRCILCMEARQMKTQVNGSTMITS